MMHRSQRADASAAMINDSAAGESHITMAERVILMCDKVESSSRRVKQAELVLSVPPSHSGTICALNESRGGCTSGTVAVLPRHLRLEDGGHKTTFSDALAGISRNKDAGKIGDHVIVSPQTPASPPVDTTACISDPLSSATANLSKAQLQEQLMQCRIMLIKSQENFTLKVARLEMQHKESTTKILSMMRSELESVKKEIGTITADRDRAVKETRLVMGGRDMLMKKTIDENTCLRDMFKLAKIDIEKLKESNNFLQAKQNRCSCCSKNSTEINDVSTSFKKPFVRNPPGLFSSKTRRLYEETDPALKRSVSSSELDEFMTWPMDDLSGLESAQTTVSRKWGVGSFRRPQQQRHRPQIEQHRTMFSQSARNLWFLKTASLAGETVRVSRSSRSLTTTPHLS